MGHPVVVYWQFEIGVSFHEGSPAAWGYLEIVGAALAENQVEVERLARDRVERDVLPHGGEGECAVAPAGQPQPPLPLLACDLFDHPALYEVADRPPAVGPVRADTALEFGEWDPDVPLLLPLCPRLPEGE